jgi:arylformamidase
MTDRWLEVEYHNRLRVPDFDTILANWVSCSAAYRTMSAGYRELSYGPSERSLIDIFPGDGADLNEPDNKPLIVFLHGGYWQALDRLFFSHVARGPVERGFSVAVVGYDLCPTVTLTDIVAQVRSACACLWHSFRRRLLLVGHSAGGHLAAELAFEPFRMLDDPPAKDLIVGVAPISGVFELEPLLGTSINQKLGLTVEDARRLSPRLRAPPGKIPLSAWVGALESSEFLRQTSEFAAHWATSGAIATAHVEPDADHFSVLDPLMQPDSRMTSDIVAMATRAQG